MEAASPILMNLQVSSSPRSKGDRETKGTRTVSFLGNGSNKPNSTPQEPRAKHRHSKCSNGIDGGVRRWGSTCYGRNGTGGRATPASSRLMKWASFWGTATPPRGRRRRTSRFVLLGQRSGRVPRLPVPRGGAAPASRRAPSSRVLPEPLPARLPGASGAWAGWPSLARGCLRPAQV
jgi:hypothetical protein